MKKTPCAKAVVDSRHCGAEGHGGGMLLTTRNQPVHGAEPTEKPRHAPAVTTAKRSQAAASTPEPGGLGPAPVHLETRQRASVPRQEESCPPTARLQVSQTQRAADGNASRAQREMGGSGSPFSPPRAWSPLQPRAQWRRPAAAGGPEKHDSVPSGEVLRQRETSRRRTAQLKT